MPSGFDIAAVYAAIVAPVSLGFGAYVHFSDRRRKLTVAVDIAALIHPMTESISIVQFEARNPGTVPIQVKQCGLARGSRQRLRFRIEKRLALAMPSIDLGSPEFPTQIAPGETFTCFADVARFCKSGPPEGEQWSDYDRVYFDDGLGNRHVRKVPSNFHTALDAACNKSGRSGEIDQ